MCRYCEKTKEFLKNLSEEGKFSKSPRPLTTDDLFSKYIYDKDRFRMYWDDLRLCPECSDKVFEQKGNCVGVKYDSFDPPKHYHLCTACGWVGPIVNGSDFEVLEEEKEIESSSI